jgi:signal transduction histidine kinase
VIGAVEISRDITKDINVQKVMMQQEKLASVGRLSAGVAHEINNPLTTILTTAMLIQEDLDPNDPTYDEMSVIANEALRCRKIVTNLLDFARQNQPDKKIHQINDIVAACISLTQKQAAFKDVSIGHNLSNNLPRTLVDKGQIEQALINLIINAVEATPPGGSIHVSTQPSDRHGFVDIIVLDTGEGIPEERLNKIFDPFFTTKDHGTGLGLAITHGIIEQHGGTIDAASSLGGGTTFTITLPGEQIAGHAT